MLFQVDRLCKGESGARFDFALQPANLGVDVAARVDAGSDFESARTVDGRLIEQPALIQVVEKLDELHGALEVGDAVGELVVVGRRWDGRQ